jgi:hypothetical protein
MNDYVTLFMVNQEFKENLYGSEILQDTMSAWIKFIVQGGYDEKAIKPYILKGMVNRLMERVETLQQQINTQSVN